MIFAFYLAVARKQGVGFDKLKIIITDDKVEPEVVRTLKEKGVTVLF
mgnify:CR=1 FL=1